jgi:hypothetical protein
MESFVSLFQIRKYFPKIKKNLIVEHLKIEANWDYKDNIGYVSISYIKCGLKIKFLGKYYRGKQDFQIYTRFNTDNTEYKEIDTDTFMNEDIESLGFLKQLCKKYSLKKIINITILYN